VSKVAIIGFVGLDHVAMLDSTPAPGMTTTILDRPRDAWPRIGGGPAFVAAALVEAGVTDAVPVSWVGPDEAGEEYTRQLAAKGIDTSGINAVAGTRTPLTILGYEPSGGCICLYDPGTRHDSLISPRQTELIAEADWVCVTIGPAAATAAVLDAMRPSAKLAWVVKHDPRALPLELAARLAARADLICFSRAEGEFVHQAIEAAGGHRSGCYRIETKGRSGAACTLHGDCVTERAEPVTVTDPTGAGDTFAGGVLAALVKGEDDPSAIVRAGQAAARRLLLARKEIENGIA